MIQLSWCNSHFVPSALGKLAEQWATLFVGCIHRAYAQYGIQLVEWSNYRHPLPQNVRDVYVHY
jgi:hypothetical protein